MRKSVLFSVMCIALLSLSLVSCKKKEVFSPVGTWKMVNQGIRTYHDGILRYTEMYHFAEGEEPIATLQADGKLFTTIDGNNIAGTYAISADFSYLTTVIDGDAKVMKVTIIDNDRVNLITNEETKTNAKGVLVKSEDIAEFVRIK